MKENEKKLPSCFGLEKGEKKWSGKLQTASSSSLFWFDSDTCGIRQTVFVVIVLFKCESEWKRVCVWFGFGTVCVLLFESEMKKREFVVRIWYEKKERKLLEKILIDEYCSCVLHFLIFCCVWFWKLNCEEELGFLKSSVAANDCWLWHMNSV